ncbi:MAG: hypothetical protein ABSH56_24485 [Bryobacteraceae bacterium]
MRTPVLTCLALLAIATGAISAAKIRVLILTGEFDVSRPWPTTIPSTRSMLLNAGRFDVRVAARGVATEPRWGSYADSYAYA